MDYKVYILQSEVTNRFYCGQTNNIEERMGRHNSGRSKFTKTERPWNIIWYAKLQTRAEAIKLERKIKKRGIKRFLEDMRG